MLVGEFDQNEHNIVPIIKVKEAVLTYYTPVKLTFLRLPILA